LLTPLETLLRVELRNQVQLAAEEARHLDVVILLNVDANGIDVGAACFPALSRFQ